MGRVSRTSIPGKCFTKGIVLIHGGQRSWTQARDMEWCAEMVRRVARSEGRGMSPSRWKMSHNAIWDIEPEGAMFHETSHPEKRLGMFHSPNQTAAACWNSFFRSAIWAL